MGREWGGGWGGSALWHLEGLRAPRRQPSTHASRRRQPLALGAKAADADFKVASSTRGFTTSHRHDSLRGNETNCARIYTRTNNPPTLRVMTCRSLPFLQIFKSSTFSIHWAQHTKPDPQFSMHFFIWISVCNQHK